jgi:hypothetical protein
MNYRTKNRRFLLKATLGATTLVMAGCSSSTGPLGLYTFPMDGSTPEGGGDAQVTPCQQGCGTVANPPDGGEDAGHVCGGGVCGSIAMPPDASDQ